MWHVRCRYTHTFLVIHVRRRVEKLRHLVSLRLTCMPPPPPTESGRLQEITENVPGGIGRVAPKQKSWLRRCATCDSWKYTVGRGGRSRGRKSHLTRSDGRSLVRDRKQPSSCLRSRFPTYFASGITFVPLGASICLPSTPSDTIVNKNLVKVHMFFLTLLVGANWCSVTCATVSQTIIILRPLRCSELLTTSRWRNFFSRRLPTESLSSLVG